MARKKKLGVDEAPQVVVDLPEGEACCHCGAALHSGGRSSRSLWRLDGPVIVIAIIRRCSRRGCPGWSEYRKAVTELDRLAPRTGDYGLDVLLAVGDMRFRERMSVPEIHAALGRRHPTLVVSERQVTRLVSDYAAFAEASLRDGRMLVAALGGRRDVTVSLDGLQPDQGKDTLWLVRDLETGLPLASMTHPSVTHVEIEAMLRSIAARGLRITGVVSDGQDCIVKAVREALPGVPHQVCQSHFLKNIAKPLLEKDGALRRELKRGCAGSARSSAPSRRKPRPLLPFAAIATRHVSLRSLPKRPQ
jgi:hypothetical protein